MAKISSPFVGRSGFHSKEFTEREFVHFYEKEKVASGFDSKNPDEFLIEKETVEYERIPIDEYINSFASKVGLKNELKGIVSKQQMDDFIASHKAEPVFVDLTTLPDTALGMEEFASRIDEIWDNIPSELRGDLTKEQFISSYNSDKLRAYVEAQIKAKQAVEAAASAGGD